MQEQPPKAQGRRRRNLPGGQGREWTGRRRSSEVASLPLGERRGRSPEPRGRTLRARKVTPPIEVEELIRYSPVAFPGARTLSREKPSTATSPGPRPRRVAFGPGSRVATAASFRATGTPHPRTPAPSTSSPRPPVGLAMPYAPLRVPISMEEVDDVGPALPSLVVWTGGSSGRGWERTSSIKSAFAVVLLSVALVES